MTAAAITSTAPLPMFESFPYLVTRVMPTLYHHMLLPSGLGELELSLLHRAQWRANRLDVCLVVGPERALFISAAGVERLDTEPPRGGVRITGRLKPSATWPDTADLRARQRRLDASVMKISYGFGDLTKGGREASTDDVARLAGAGPEGAPRGLERCPGCAEWRGICLDPSPRFFGKVMTVHCRFANDNRCAACGQPLYKHKLDANYYNPRDGQIWHVPAFCGLSHECMVRSERRAL
jgi:hypothetical protein